MRIRRTVAAAIAAATVASILVPAPGAAAPGPDYVIDEAQVAAEIASVEAATGQSVISGEIKGAAWIGQIPENWNGDLVIYAHGYRGEGTDLTVSAPPEFEWLVEEGYAWAASSYRRNSYDPGIGMIDTKNLTYKMQRKLWRLGFRDPSAAPLDKTYITGVSMGGHVTAATIEKFPWLYDGALPACGVVGDVELFDFFLDYNAGAAAFAGLGPDYEAPTPDWTTTTVPVIKQALSTDPTGQWAGGLAQILGAPSPLTAEGEEFKDFVEIGTGGDRVGFDVAWNYWHGIADPSGNFFFALGEGDGTIANRPGLVAQNTDMTYLEEYGVDIDDEVRRQEAAFRWRRPWGNKPAPLIKGNLYMPVLSIHTTGDLFVPIEMEQIYAREVEANGYSDLLVTRSMRDVGHCTFTGEEWQQSYSDLFNWVENGVKPEGEDLLNDISSPDLGCDFTIGDGGSGYRGYLDPCGEHSD